MPKMKYIKISNTGMMQVILTDKVKAHCYHCGDFHLNGRREKKLQPCVGIRKTLIYLLSDMDRTISSVRNLVSFVVIQ